MPKDNGNGNATKRADFFKSRKAKLLSKTVVEIFEEFKGAHFSIDEIRLHTCKRLQKGNCVSNIRLTVEQLVRTGTLKHLNVIRHDTQIVKVFNDSHFEMQDAHLWLSQFSVNDKNHRFWRNEAQNLCENFTDTAVEMFTKKLTKVTTENIRLKIIILAPVFLKYFANKLVESKNAQHSFEHWPLLFKIFNQIFKYSNEDERRALSAIITKYFTYLPKHEKHYPLYDYTRFILFHFWYADEEIQINIINSLRKLHYTKRECLLLISVFNYFEKTDLTKSILLSYFIEKFQELFNVPLRTIRAFKAICYLLSPAEEYYCKLVDQPFFAHAFVPPVIQKHRLAILEDLRSYFIPHCAKFVLTNVSFMMKNVNRAEIVWCVLNNCCDEQVKPIMISVIEYIVKYRFAEEFYVKPTVEISDKSFEIQKLNNPVLLLCRHVLEYDAFLYANMGENDSIIFFSTLFMERLSNELLMHYTRSTFGICILNCLMNTKIPQVQKRVLDVLKKCDHLKSNNSYGVAELLEKYYKFAHHYLFYNW